MSTQEQSTIDQLVELLDLAAIGPSSALAEKQQGSFAPIEKLTLTELNAMFNSNEYSAEFMLQHAMSLLNDTKSDLITFRAIEMAKLYVDMLKSEFYSA